MVLRRLPSSACSSFFTLLITAIHLSGCHRSSAARIIFLRVASSPPRSRPASTRPAGSLRGGNGSSASASVSAPAVRRTSFGGAASSYTRGVVEPYFELVWVKWRLLLAALQEGGARAALWLDADVVLFRNPWELHPALGSASYDIRYQSEFACAGPCASVDQPTDYRLHSHRAAHPKPVESMGSWAEAEGPPTPA